MDHIIPAIPLTKTDKELSPSELQKLLHNWFNDKGLLTDLRCHLRRQMIEILRNTTVGRNIVKAPNKSSTLSQQAMNLVVAEYLIRNHCHYSLSMFNTEVTLTSNLPEFSTIFDSCDMFQNWQFSVENLVNILELNGITKHSKICHRIISLYYECEGNPSLLNTLIKALSEITNNSFKNSFEDQPLEERKFEEMDSGDVATIRMLKNMLSATNLSPHVIEQIVSKISVQCNKITKQKDEDIRTVIEALKLDIGERDAKISEQKLQNESLKRKIIKKIGENKELKTNIQSLLLGEKLMQKEYEKLKRLSEVSKIEQETQYENPSRISEEKAVNTGKIETRDCLLDHCNEMCRDALKVIEHLKQENVKLVQESNEQKHEVINLSTKCNQLLDEFNMCRSRLSNLNQRISERNLPSCKNDYITECSTSEDTKTGEVSSLDSLSDDILYQARLKLKLLEKETEEIDRRYSTIC